MKQASSSVWSIQDVPLKAREQVFAAANREGVSVGDWLARNIMGDAPDIPSASAAEGQTHSAPQPPSLGAGDPLANRSRRRVEEALLALSHVLESHERAQEHASQTIQSVAAEVRAATREQAAFLQNLGGRIEAVEGHSGDIGRRTRETAERLSALASDLEALGNKIVTAREASDRFGLFVQEQLSTFAERVRASEARGANLSRIDADVARLGETHLGLAGKLDEVTAKFERLVNDVHSAREISDRMSVVIQDKVTAVEQRMRDTDARAVSMAQFERAAGMLQEGQALVSGQVSGLAADIARLTGQIADARADSSSVEAGIREELAAIAARVTAAERQIAKQDEFERSIVALNAQDNAIASKIGALSGSFTQLQGDIQSIRESAAATAEDVQKANAGIAKVREEAGAGSGRIAELQAEIQALRAATAEDVQKANAGIAKVSEEAGIVSSRVAELQAEIQSVRDSAMAAGREAQQKADAVAEGIGGLVDRVAQVENGVRSAHEISAHAIESIQEKAAAFANVERLQDEIAAVRDGSNRFASVVDEKLGEISQHLNSFQNPDVVFAEVEKVAAALRDRVDAVELSATDAAKRSETSINQNRDAIGILIEQNHAQTTEVRGLREALNRIEQALADVQEDRRAALSRVDANLSESSARSPAVEEQGEPVAEAGEPAEPPVVLEATGNYAAVTVPAEVHPAEDDWSAELSYSVPSVVEPESQEADSVLHAVIEPESHDTDSVLHLEEAGASEEGAHAGEQVAAADGIFSDAGFYVEDPTSPETSESSADGEHQELAPSADAEDMDLPRAPDHQVADILAESEAEAVDGEGESGHSPEALSEQAAEGDYLTEARRAAREAHERSAREGNLKGDWAKSITDEARTRYLQPVLAGILVFVVAAIAFWLARPSPSNTNATTIPAVKPAAKSRLVHAAVHASAHNESAVVSQPIAPANAPSLPAAAVQTQSSLPPVSGATAVPAGPASLDQIKTWAEKGDAKAMLALGVAYEKGTGIAADQIQATAWLQRAAQAGDPVAEFRLGVRLEKGVGAPKDPIEAVHWYKLAAAQGNRSAMYNLGVASANGLGVAKDFREAARWFKSAASLGLTDSQFNLAVLYEHGWGVGQSLASAYQWYSIAASGGDAQSREHADALATQISAADKAAADRAAAAFEPEVLKPGANDLPAVLKTLEP